MQQDRHSTTLSAQCHYKNNLRTLLHHTCFTLIELDCTSSSPATQTMPSFFRSTGRCLSSLFFQSIFMQPRHHPTIQQLAIRNGHLRPLRRRQQQPDRCRRSQWSTPIVSSDSSTSLPSSVKSCTSVYSNDRMSALVSQSIDVPPDPPHQPSGEIH